MNILEMLTKDEKKLLKVVSVKKGAFLYNALDICENITIIVSGEVKISGFTPSGEEFIYNVSKKNDVFGNNLVFSDKPIYKGNAIAVKDSTVVKIYKKDLLRILQSNSDFLLSYLAIQSNNAKKLNSTIKMLSYSSAEDRLRHLFYENNNEIEFSSISHLADVLHLKRETLSRLLTKLEKENAIKRSPHKLTLLD